MAVEAVLSTRLFVLERHQDATGVSGTGIVADGVLWPDGRATLCWRASAAGTIGAGSIGLYGSIDELLEVYAHSGRT